ncbi:hypothetical protein SLEP1_g8836 [Rubroshorea leprosula]|uniref:Bifunctional inhibitor/plant lipid transfer protein/seed storage helical domain-containing protein n=1 Tax=Rubroshorea leprosula TaxID=152421 RepID=A0AAV5IAX3_9ROSI|nr:hypothetical protein SLEP1_g8836 [Rubroshorea leprosula]
MAKLTIAAVILVLAATMSLTEAQNTSTSCASELQTSCASDLNSSYLNSSYLNSSTIPSGHCCTAFTTAAVNELTCLCNLYNNPDVLKPFNISLPVAVQLALNCRYVCTFLVNCTNALSPTECVYPPPSPGQAGSDRIADRIVWTGVTSLLLFLALAVLY